MKAEFVILGEPFGKERHRYRNCGSYTKEYTPQRTVSYENLVKIEYERQCGCFSFDDYEMLDLRVFAFYAIPKSVSKKKRALMLDGIIRPVKRPDYDNIGKIVSDALNKIAYRDDAQIVDAMVRKFYSDTPHVKVVLKTATAKKRSVFDPRKQYEDIVALYGIDLLRDIVRVYEDEGN